jgi:hypothetical protein
MKTLPTTSASPLLRTDFSDQAAWEAVCDEIGTPGVEGFKAEVEPIDDKAFDSLTVPQILETVPEGYSHTFIIVADRLAMAPEDRTLLVVNLDSEGAGRHFRAAMSEMWGVENNLSIANMDFDEFADAVDSNGVHRGF